MPSAVQYYPITADDLDWFCRLIDDRADDPSHVVTAGWVKNGLELELYFWLKGSSRGKINEQACLELTRLVSERTGVTAPVVYDLSWPHSAALAAINAAPHRKWPAIEP